MFEFSIIQIVPRLLFIFLFLLVGITTLRVVSFYLFPLRLHAGQTVTFSTTLLEDPKVQFGQQSFHVRIGNFWQSSQLLILTHPSQLFIYGDNLAIRGIISQKRIAGKETLTLSKPQITLQSGTLLPFFGNLRQRLKDLCNQLLPQPYSGLVRGILLGDKTSVAPQTASSFQETGLSHLLVVDGMKITLVASFLIDLLASIFKRKVALLLSMVGIGIYMVLSGLEISALRAGIMAMAAFSAQLWGRQYTGLYSLFLVSAGLLLWDPLLLQGVGFQLSIAATAGIILLKPLLPLKGILLDDIAITFAATLATLPILFGTFGSYSLSSLPVHALVMWTIPPIILFGGIGLIAGVVAAPLGKVVSLLCLPFLWYLQHVSDFFAQFGWQVHITQLPLLFTIGWYCLLVAVVLLVKRRIES